MQKKLLLALSVLALPLVARADYGTPWVGYGQVPEFGISSGATVNDDQTLCLGTDCDAWLEYDTALTPDAVCLYMNDSDGGGTDGAAWCVDTGTDLVRFPDGIRITTLDTVTGGIDIASSGLITTTGANLISNFARYNDDVTVQFGSGIDCWLEHETATTPDQTEFECTDVDGGGTDGVVWYVANGTDDVVFYGGISLPVAQCLTLDGAGGNDTLCTLVDGTFALKMNGATVFQASSTQFWARRDIQLEDTAALIGEGAKINVGGTAASTHSLGDDDLHVNTDFEVDGFAAFDGAQYVKGVIIDVDDTPYTVLATDFAISCDPTAGTGAPADVTVNLPAATGSGRLIELTHVGSSNNCVLAPNGTDNLHNNGAGTPVNVTAGQTYMLRDCQGSAAYDWCVR